MIVDREKEIRSFVPEEYWTIEGKFQSKAKKVLNTTFYGDETGKVELKCETDSDAILKRAEQSGFYVSELKRGTRKKQPLPPYITSTLQQDCVKRLGFTSERTMRAAQALYEGVNIPGKGSIGLITYMRTDSLAVVMKLTT